MSKIWVESMERSVRQIDPWSLSSSLAKRATCGIEGTCSGCRSFSDRLTTLDCGAPQGGNASFSFSKLLFAALSVPVAVVYALRQAWHGGMFAFIPAVSSWILAYTLMLLYDMYFGRQRGYEFAAMARFVWSFPIAAFIEWLFKLAWLGTLAMLGSVMTLLAYLYYPLFALEAYSKVSHSLELAEKVKAGHT
jgi:hypothetical protein